MKYINALVLVLLFPALHASCAEHSIFKNCYPLPDSTKVTLTKDTASQDTATKVKVKHKKYVIGLNGASDQASHGVHNSSALPYIEPGFTYYAKSGFYIEASNQFLLVKKNGGFDVLGLNPGWDIDFTDNTTLNVNYQYYHFKKKTPNEVSSSLGNDLETYIEQDIGDLTGTFTIDYDIYTQQNKNQPKTPNDFIFTPDVEYDFEIDFGKKSSLTFTPEINLEFGTRNFYTQYLDNKANDSANNGLKPKKIEYASNSNSSFGTLNYDVILSIEYKVSKFSFTPSVTYCHPLYNPLPTSNKPFVYGSISMKYTIKSKK